MTGRSRRSGASWTDVHRRDGWARHGAPRGVGPRAAVCVPAGLEACLADAVLGLFLRETFGEQLVEEPVAREGHRLEVARGGAGGLVVPVDAQPVHGPGRVHGRVLLELELGEQAGA